jgi:ribose/xylose/arabinose/galactoside ABC-type transport system permease subunit
MSAVAETPAVRRTPLARRVRTAMPFVLLAVMLVAFFVLPGLSGRSAGTFNVYNAMQNWASVGLLALGVGLTMIAGEFDLGALGIYAFAGMIAVRVGGHGALLGIVVAVAVGGLIGLVQGVIVARLRINSMPVTLGFYIALIGATSALSHSKSVSFSNLDIGATLDATKLEFFSWRSLIAIIVFALVIVVLRFTRLGRELRAIGGDRRASRVVGVGVDRVLVGTFVVSGLCSAIGGSLLAYSLATAVPDPGIAPLTFAVTATLIGGVSLVGGVGSPLGIAAGGITLSLLQELFSVLATPDYVENIVTGTLLVVATIIAAPELVARWKSLRAPRAVHAAAPEEARPDPAPAVTP